MQKKITLISILLATMAISGCSNFQFPWVYKVRIQQGNYLEQDMVAKLKQGMTKSQVRFIMGTPMIEDTFSPDRWDYYFIIKRGEKIFNEYHMTMLFSHDQLQSWDGNYAKTDEIKKKEAAEAEKTSKRAEDAKF